MTAFFSVFSLFSCFFFRDSNGLVKFIQPKKHNRNLVGYYISDEEDEYVERNDSSDCDSIAAHSDMSESPHKSKPKMLLRVRKDLFADSANDNTENSKEDANVKNVIDLKTGEKALRSNRDPRRNPGRLSTPPPLMSLPTLASRVIHIINCANYLNLLRVTRIAFFPYSTQPEGFFFQYSARGAS